MYADLIPFGHISRASIRDLRSSDIPPSTRQAHFFAGIGGWPLALQLANWPSSIPVWTGSCPCQPYSVAGKRKGDADDRNLWPQFLRLIRHHRPPVCFGEQVAGKDGKVWLDGVRSDLEKLGYEVGAADLCAAGVGAPHIRQRLYWVAFATGQGWERRIAEAIREEQRTVERGGVIGGVAHSQSTLRGPSPLHWPDHINEIQKGPQSPSSSGERGQSCSGGVVHPQRNRPKIGEDFNPIQYKRCNGKGRASIESGRPGDIGTIADGGLDNPTDPRRTRHGLLLPSSPARDKTWLQESPGRGAFDQWSNFQLIPCLDGYYRRIEPGTHPLSHGVPSRLVKLRGYGNAIVPPLAAEFIRSFLECLPGL